MTATRASADVHKPSFAKIAASTSREMGSSSDARRSSKSLSAALAEPAAPSQTSTNATSPLNAMPTSNIVSAKTATLPKSRIDDEGGLANAELEGNARGGSKALALEPKRPGLVINGVESSFPYRSRLPIKEAVSEGSQKADSSSDLGTKPPSLDGKSITSGTTFALDEKESLRPDDSASVKAAAEDDDSFSVRGSFLPSSRMGSELAARTRGIHLGDIPERRPYPVSGVHNPGEVIRHSGSSEQQAIANGSIALVSVPSSADALNTIYAQAPDEKLLDAMRSPKDRLYLLRLEKDVIEFVQDSKEPYMDIPPSNSFCRMLTHKLADYYHMTHSFEPHIGSVRIFRTPFCRVPQSLASMDVSPSNGSTPPPAVLPKRIMRRGEDGEQATASASPSKPTSEVDDDSKEKSAPAKEKLTREEREEAYNRARERIFGNAEKTGESTPDNDDENGISRASSVSARDKTNVTKKTKMRQRRGSDSFESRTQYTPYWGAQQPTWIPQAQPPYMVPNAPGHPTTMASTQPYGAPMVPGYIPPAQNFGQPPMMGGIPYPAPAPFPTGPPHYQPPPMSQGRYPQPPNPGMGTYAPPPPPAAAPPQPGWQPPYNSVAYGPGSRATPVPLPIAPGIPYPYGQLPANANPHDPKSQHPIPGSYQRHGFNPNTKSFVPGSSFSPILPPQPPYTAPGSHQSSPQIGSQNLAFTGYQQPVPPQPYGSNAGYGMVRQASNTSLPPFYNVHQGHTAHPSPMPPLVPQHPSPHMQQHIPHNLPPHIPNKPAIPQGPPTGPQTYSHLPNYGNPATLPQRPTTTGA